MIFVNELFTWKKCFRQMASEFSMTDRDKHFCMMELQVFSTSYQIWVVPIIYLTIYFATLHNVLQFLLNS